MKKLLKDALTLTELDDEPLAQSIVFLVTTYTDEVDTSIDGVLAEDTFQSVECPKDECLNNGERTRLFTLKSTKLAGQFVSQIIAVLDNFEGGRLCVFTKGVVDLEKLQKIREG